MGQTRDFFSSDFRRYFGIGPKRDKSVTFQIGVQTIFVSVSQNKLKFNPGLSHLGPIWSTLSQFRSPAQNNLKQQQQAGMVGLAPKWVRLDPKLDKSGTFSDQISVHLAHRAKCTEIWSEKSRICPIMGPIWPTLALNLPSLVILVSNWINQGRFKINVSVHYLACHNWLKYHLKLSRIYPIGCQSDPHLVQIYIPKVNIFANKNWD